MESDSMSSSRNSSTFSHVVSPEMVDHATYGGYHYDTHIDNNMSTPENFPYDKKKLGEDEANDDFIADVDDKLLPRRDSSSFSGRNSTDDEDFINGATAPPVSTKDNLRCRFCHKVWRAIWWNSYSRLLLHSDRRGFMWLWLSGVISQLGSWFSFIATLTLVTNSGTDASGLMVGGIFFTSWVPPMLLNPVTGVLADKLDKRKVMIASDVIRGFVCLGMLFIAREVQAMESANASSVTFWLLLLYVCNAVLFAGNAFFDPCREGIVPELVEPEELIAANALDSITYSALSFLGAALGGAVTSTLGIQADYIFDIAGFFASAFCILQVYRCQKYFTPRQEGAEVETPFPTAPPLEGTETGSTPSLEESYSDSPRALEDNYDESYQDQHDESEGVAETAVLMPGEAGELPRKPAFKWLLGFWSSLFKGFAEGLKFLWHHKYVMWLILAKFSGGLVWGGIDMDIVKFSESSFKLGKDASAMLGITNAVIGVSCGIVPVFMERLVPSRPKAMRISILFGYVILFLGIFSIAWSPNVWVFLAGNAIYAAGSGIIWVYSSSSLQQLLPADLRGRILALDMSLHTVGQTVSLIWCSMALDKLDMGPRMLAATLTIISAVVLVIWTIVIWWYRHVKEHAVLEMVSNNSQETKKSNHKKQQPIDNNDDGDNYDNIEAGLAAATVDFDITTDASDNHYGTNYNYDDESDEEVSTTRQLVANQQ
eukprot:GEZU01015727.1.p1 GENE.GEZU01015727.1~~GEZU01015727.1.p1  ORF type:complete len:713 (-),score=170.41 GEZU01015727.1:16-2154(-)